MFALFQEPNGNQGPGKFPAAERCNLDFDLSPGPLIADYRFISITFRFRGKARGLAPLPLLTIGFFQRRSACHIQLPALCSFFARRDHRRMTAYQADGAFGE